ncbi:hypothetical protein [Rheinheimera aquimaris]|uniref:hypothetical protein n=1 Tax=Rheinheimera aquimaris TaxID=412437 RepID=UPI000E8566D6|nr:hypothetical protein [Rheinheimera sp.]|tara:strand:- start:903 stop:1421 length:519 start_codon:yes stop_codon:yes gene_type:complete
MTTGFDVNIELLGFNLDRMHPAAKANLTKLAELLGQLDDEAWWDYIDNGAIDLTALAKELNISRSSIYQNDHIKRYLLNKAESLISKKMIVELPYRSREKNKISDHSAGMRYSVTDKEIREKNLQIKHLQTQVAELSAEIDGLKAALMAAKQEIEKSNFRERHLAQSGRLLR